MSDFFLGYMLTFCFVCHAAGRTGSFAVYRICVSEISKSSSPPKGSTGTS